MNGDATLAHIKEVVSGDTFVLCGTPRGGPPWEKCLSLSSIRCPVLTSYQLCSTSVEEPYAWKAREYARKKLIGKTIEYKIEFIGNGREFGWIKLEGSSFAHEILSNGLAMVIMRSDKKCAFDYDDLVRLQTEAKDRGIGIWSIDEAIDAARVQPINANNDVDIAHRFFNQYNKQKVTAIIERIHHGSCMDLLFTNEMLYATVSLTGIQCNAPSNGDNNSVSLEAKFFVEIRLLNREVEVRLEARNFTGSMYGTVYHPLGNISYLLLSYGFAKVDEAYAYQTEFPSKLFECMAEAARKHLRIWKQAVAPIKSLAHVKEYSAIIYEIVNGDCFVLLLPDGSTRRVFLASIGCPRVANRSKEAELWAPEALEVARKELIGRRVNVTKEYTRTSTNKPIKSVGKSLDDLGELNSVNIDTINDNVSRNISEILVSKGLAKVIPSRNNDPCASNYEVLVDLEKKAIKEKLGLHSQASSAPKHRINDLSENVKAQYVKFFLQELKSSSPLEGIVRYVIGPSCFKLYIPKKGLIITFGIEKIRSVRFSRQPDTASTDGNEYGLLGEQALHFAKKTLMQRDVTIEVSNCSNSGLFLGNLLYRKRMNYAEDLLRLGFAHLVDSSLSAGKDVAALKAAEKDAQNESVGIWRLEKVGGDATDVEDSIVNEVLEAVTISHMDSFVNFYLQKSASAEIKQIVEELDTVETNTTDLLIRSHPLKKNEVVVAKFSEDGKWYRAIIQNWNSIEQSYQVLYGDYGNVEKVEKSLIMKCPGSLVSIPWQAIRCSLGGVLPSEEFMEAASHILYDRAAHATLKCQIECRHNDLNMVILYCYQNASINEDIVAVGYAQYDRKKKFLSIADRLNNAEGMARKAHLNLWRFGDAYHEENDDYY